MWGSVFIKIFEIRMINKLVINRTEERGLDCYGSGNERMLESCENVFEIIYH